MLTLRVRGRKAVNVTKRRWLRRQRIKDGFAFFKVAGTTTRNNTGEVKSVKERVKGIIQGLMCRFNRHEYIVRLAFAKAGCNLRTCRHCGKSQVYAQEFESSNHAASL